MAVRRGPAKASTRPAAWRWQLICAAVSVAAGACCFASGAPALPGVYIDEAFLKALATELMQDQYELSPELMEQDYTIKGALRYLCEHICGVANVVMEQFRVGAECPDDPAQTDVAIRLFETDWAKNYLAARPQLEPLISYSNAIREEEFDILINLIFQHIDKSTIREAGDPRIIRDNPRCLLSDTDAFQKEVETKLGRSIFLNGSRYRKNSPHDLEDLPEGRESWITYSIHQLPNNLFDIELRSHASRESMLQKKVMLRYNGIYSWTPETGPSQYQRFKVTEIYYPDFANHSKHPKGGDWEATRNFHDTWDENYVTVKNKRSTLASKELAELATTEKTFTWRKGNDYRANKFRENIIGKIKYNAETNEIAPPKFAVLDITREKSFEDGQDEAMKVERCFDLDPLPAKLRIFYREEPLLESGMKALHCGIFIDANSLKGPAVSTQKDSAEWPTLGSTFALEITKKVENVPNPPAPEHQRLNIDIRIAAQTGPNQRFLHLAKYVAPSVWSSDALSYDDQDMTPSARKIELRELKISEEPNLQVAHPDLAKQLGIDVPEGNGLKLPSMALDQGTPRKNPWRPCDKNISILGKACSGATFYLVANRILSSHEGARHYRTTKVGEKRGRHSSAW